jgi:hypothetical protein
MHNTGHYYIFAWALWYRYRVPLPVHTNMVPNIYSTVSVLLRGTKEGTKYVCINICKILVPGTGKIF